MLICGDAGSPIQLHTLICMLCALHEVLNLTFELIRVLSSVSLDFRVLMIRIRVASVHAMQFISFVQCARAYPQSHCQCSLLWLIIIVRPFRLCVGILFFSRFVPSTAFKSQCEFYCLLLNWKIIHFSVTTTADVCNFILFAIDSIAEHQARNCYIFRFIAQKKPRCIQFPMENQSTVDRLLLRILLLLAQ